MLVLTPAGPLDYGGPTVTVDLPPPPEAGSGFLSPILFALLLISIGLIIRHRRQLKDGGARGLRTLALGAALGNVLLDLGSTLMPTQPDAICVQNLEDVRQVEEVERIWGHGGSGSPSHGLQTVHAVIHHEFPVHAIGRAPPFSGFDPE